MHDGELRTAGISQHKSGWRDRLPFPRLDETTLLHRIFGGYFRSQVRCNKCQYSSNTYDPFLDLALEVSRKGCGSIRRAIQDFVRKETLDADNRWRCSKCQRHVRATKQITVFRPPLCLSIQLKRFSFHGGTSNSNSNAFLPYGMKFGSSGGGGGSKVSKPIEYPAHLQLPLSDGRNCHYALTGIVVHHGHSATSGHYTAFCKTPPKKISINNNNNNSNSNGWYHMDDSHTDPVSETTVLQQQRGVYLLFYSRTEVKLELPSPPPPPPSPSPTSMEKKNANPKTDNRVRLLAQDKNQPQQNEENENEPVDHQLFRRKSARARANSFERQIKEEEKKTKEKMEIDSIVEKQQQLKKKQAAASVIEKVHSKKHKQEEAGSKTTTTKGSINDPSKSQKQQKKNKENSSTFSDDDSDSSSSSEEEEQEKQPNGESSDSSSSEEDEGKDENSNRDSGTPETKRLKRKQQKMPQDTAGLLRTPSPMPTVNKIPDTDMAVDGRNKTESSSSSEEDDSSDDGEEEDAHAIKISNPAHSSPQQLISSSTPPHSKLSSTDNQSETKPSTNAVKHNNKTRVVLNRGGTKVEVMVGPRFCKNKRAWKPKAAAPGRKDDRHELLGSVGVGKWGDDNDNDNDNEDSTTNGSIQIPARGNLVKRMLMEESSRKRKLYLDRYDIALDLGKKKKVKSKASKESIAQMATTPQTNAFQKIQSSMQKTFQNRAKQGGSSGVTKKFRGSAVKKHQPPKKHSLNNNKRFRR